MLLVLCLLVLPAVAYAKPNIVIIVADDLGWNDVGFHGSNQYPTPNIDALAVSGLMLHNYYVTPLCTPSRASLMTGKYAIHTGMQHSVIFGSEPRGLPLSEKILPQYMKDLGYRTHLVGKWHLGNYKKEYLPLNRGFDSHLGFWTGKIDMFDHTTMERGSWGHDFRRGFEVAYDLYGRYATDVYAEEAVRLISSHNKSEPLFLMVCHSAVHSGNEYEFLRAPETEVEKFKHIEDTQRRKFAAMVSKMDESVGKVVKALQESGLLENSIVLFTTDNGGAAAGFNDNAASNYPLRGVKNTAWEGGVRGAGALWSPLIAKKSRAAAQKMHIVDWLPTLYSAAGGNLSVFEGIDGLDLWPALSNDQPSERTSILHNIDDIWSMASITVDEWKVIKGMTYDNAWNGWYGPSGRSGAYDIDAVYSSHSGKAITDLGLMPDKQKAIELREASIVQCNETAPSSGAAPCDPLKEPCLFNISEDPCEKWNLAQQEPEILHRVLAELERLNKTAVPPNNKPLDPLGDPKHWGRVYTNFGDYALTQPIENCL